MNRQLPVTTGEAALRLQVGGTLVPGRDIYIARPEDEQLFELLSGGEYVNILSSRQVGKSSLMLRTAFRLRERGHRFAVVDLTSLGTPENARSYFRGLVGEIARQLRLQFDAKGFWREDDSSETNSQQFIRFFRDEIARQIDAPVVICLDEIDSTLKLPFTDDLFTALRSMYNERATVPAYQRIAFCLVGVATPDELIKDRRTTPYNVGKTLSLGDFDAARDDLNQLVEVLSDDGKLGAELLRRVLRWTGGHPFLTTKLCQDLGAARVAVPEDVDRFVEQGYGTLEGLGEDVHVQQILRFLRERLTDGLATFNLYEKILKGEKERDQPSLAHAELKLSGLVKRDSGGILIPRNRIYERLFGPDWVRRSRPKQEVRRYRRLAYAASAVLVLGLIGGITYYQRTVVPLEERDAARKALEALRVTLSNDPGGWTNIGLPAQDTQAILQKALPHLAALGAARDAQGLSLDLSDVPGFDLNGLAPLTGLRRLNLMATKLTDLGPLAKLTGLQELDISSNPVTNFTPLATLANLRQLSAAMTLVSDLTPLNGLANLESLDIAGTPATDLSPLARLTNLHRLDVSSTQVSNLAPLAGLTGLTELNVSRTAVKDLTPLNGLTSLRTLALDGLGITDFNANGRMPNLKILRDPAATKTGIAYKPGETFRDCRQCPQMVIVPAGTFVMGSPASEAGRSDNEGPQRKVSIVRPFAIGKYEVRFDEWMLCVQDGRCEARPDEGWGRGLRPVIDVSWQDAKRYTAWLAEKTGQPYRLLTEAEWEYAARAGSKGPHYWNEGEDACTYRRQYGCKNTNFGTAQVGAFQPNAFGLHDMLGNVWEWVEDCYHDSYKGAPTDGSAWMSDACGSRVIRGGGWGLGSRNMRSAIRNGYPPGDRLSHLGFRVARTLTP